MDTNNIDQMSGQDGCQTNHTAPRVMFCFEPDRDTHGTKPLMLETAVFCPLFTWVSRKLQTKGITRFFVACDAKWNAEIRACFSGDVELTVSDKTTDMDAYLSQEGTVMVFPASVIPVPVDGKEGYVYTVDAADLRQGWANDGHDLQTAQKVEGFTAIHSVAQLQMMQTICRDAILLEHLAQGVLMLDPSTVYIDPRVTIAPGTTLLPGTILRGNTQIGADCTIGPNAMVRDCTVGHDTTINASQTNESTIGSHTAVGPFAYLRPNCTIGDHVKVGDFVEVKNSVLGDGTKLSHLTYVGDSDVGKNVNMGCGTVTTNYDGFKKFRCTVEDDAFVGCNTNLIAPVTVGKGSYIAAGATITKDVPADALAVARAHQIHREGWAKNRRAQHGK